MGLSDSRNGSGGNRWRIFYKGCRSFFRGSKIDGKQKTFFCIRFKIKRKFAQKKYDKLKILEKSFSSESFLLKLSGGVNVCVLELLGVIMTLFRP